MGLFLVAFSSSPKFGLRAALSVKTGFHANRVLLKVGSSETECNSALTQSDHGRADAATSLSWRGQPVGLFVGFYLPIFSQPYLINTSDEFKFSPLWDSFESKWVRCNKKDQIDKICSFLVLFHPWALTRGKQSNWFLKHPTVFNIWQEDVKSELSSTCYRCADPLKSSCESSF